MSMKHLVGAAWLLGAGVVSAAGISLGGVGFDDGSSSGVSLVTGPLTVQMTAASGYASSSFAATFGQADYFEIVRNDNRYDVAGLGFFWQDDVLITGGVGQGKARLNLDTLLQAKGVAGDAGVTFFLFDHLLTPAELTPSGANTPPNNPFGIDPLLDAYVPHVNGVESVASHYEADFDFTYGQHVYLLALYNGGSGTDINAPANVPTTLRYDTKISLSVLGNPQAEVVSGVPVTPAVPEPSAVAMLLAGFGVVGVATRRRRV